MLTQPVIENVIQKMPGTLGIDPHSYANFNQVEITHYDINLKTDFKRKIFYGYVDISAKIIDNNTEYLCLDVRSLAVERVSTNNKSTSWIIPETSNMGSCLSIIIPDQFRNTDSGFTVRIQYSTTSESGAIQWLEPHQTAGKIHPYCYTQCEAILARSLLPCFDTPSVKVPYTISVSCPSPLMAVCSGILINTETNDDYVSYSYSQTNPIPSYLIAIVVGKLEKGAIGPRSSVYAEKELLDRSVYEFSGDTENYLRAGEEITGVPYDWGVYDMLVLPSTFPYGGMENPNLTFISASMLAGDRSLNRVVAHEITHSWFGNYVTNNRWNNFWLNEGFTVYVERMIIRKVTNSIQHRHFEMLLGYNDLKKTINNLGDNHEFTKLCPNLNGIDPDDAFSKIPYEKGSLFLFYLETKVGGEEKMQKWLNSYVKTFRNESINTDQMKQHFIDHFGNIDVDWDTWLYAPGLPPFDPTTILDDTLTKKCIQLALDWIRSNGTIENDCFGDFNARQKMFFLDEIINNNSKLNQQSLVRMDSLYDLSKSSNVEIQFRWFQLCLKNNYLDVIPQIDQFLSKHGRGLYVKPLYKLLHEVDHSIAVNIYQKNRPYYHSVIRSVFDQLLF